MNIHDAMKDLQALKDDSMDGVVQELESRFGALPETLKEVLNMKPDWYETRKTNEIRKLDKQDILDFQYMYDSEIDLLANGMIPLFDAYDANYIVYLVDDNSYGIFDITIDADPPYNLWTVGKSSFAELIEKYF